MPKHAHAQIIERGLRRVLINGHRQVRIEHVRRETVDRVLFVTLCKEKDACLQASVALVEIRAGALGDEATRTSWVNCIASSSFARVTAGNGV